MEKLFRKIKFLNLAAGKTAAFLFIIIIKNLK